MTGLGKIGYFLLGAGTGMMVMSLLYERELRLPVGEDEEFTPAMEENPDKLSEDVPEEFPEFEEIVDTPKYDVDIALNTIKDDHKEWEPNNLTNKTGYSRMYRDGKQALDKMLNQIDESEPDHPSDDIPEEDLNSDGSEYVRERVEENFEVYLEENPQDFITLIFYQGDETLCDDREQLISNPEDVVGTVALERLVTGGPGGEEGVIFVRNLKTMLNYEVVLDAGSYSETVLGIFEAKLNKGDGGDVDNR